MDQAKLKEALKEALTQAFLRSFLFIPANEFKAVIDAIRKTETDIDKEVESAISSIRKSSELVSSLESRLSERSALLEKLKDEYKRLSELTSITKEQTAALSASIRDTIGVATRKERFVSLLINLAAGIIVFLLGVVFGPPLTRWLGGLF
jgi:predicted transcriptional regulator